MGKQLQYETIDTWEVNQISIAMVAEDWGLRLRSRFKKGTYSIECPNPKHSDKHLGNCLITDNGDKNCFYCFACGAGGGPINLVMLLENCDFVKAKEMLAYKYNKIQTTLVDVSTLPPKWEGLTLDEYKEFGLQNPTVQIPYGIDDKGETLYHFDRYSLRDFARECPELHDQMLVDKFFEKIFQVSNFLALLDNGELWLIDSIFMYDKEWETACSNIIKNLKTLLIKGVINKEILKAIFVENIFEILKETPKEETEEEVYEDPFESELVKRVQEEAMKLLISKRMKKLDIR